MPVPSSTEICHPECRAKVKGQQSVSLGTWPVIIPGMQIIVWLMWNDIKKNCDATFWHSQQQKHLSIETQFWQQLWWSMQISQCTRSNTCTYQMPHLFDISQRCSAVSHVCGCPTLQYIQNTSISDTQVYNMCIELTFLLISMAVAKLVMNQTNRPLNRNERSSYWPQTFVKHTVVYSVQCGPLLCLKYYI